MQIMIQTSAQILQPNMHVWQGCGCTGKAGRETSLSGIREFGQNECGKGVAGQAIQCSCVDKALISVSDEWIGRRG